MPNPRLQLQPPNPKHGTATSAEREQAIQAIEKFYDTGVRSLSKYPGRMKYGEMSKHAANFKLNPDLLSKARALAGPDGYSKRELKELCGLILQHGFDHGRPVSHVHVIRFMAIPKHRRTGFQREAIAGHWKVHRINAEIRLRYGRAKNWAGGRKPRSAESPEEACYDLLRLAQQWMRICRALRQTDGTDVQVGPIRKDLPQSVRDRVEALDTAVAQLHKALLNRVPE